MQFINFGNGSDGDLTISSNTTESPIDSSCSGTSGTDSLSATNASFSANQIIMIHQSRGTGVGAWEYNQILSYTAGTITTVYPLANTYTDSGSSQAQVRVVKQYKSVNIQASYQYKPKAWDGNAGGILAFLCSGKVTVAGSIVGTGLGYRGGAGVGDPDLTGNQGEGTSGAGTSSVNANGNGGGGGNASVDNARKGGGGGGHFAIGTAGGYIGSSAGRGLGGGTSGVEALTTLTFGGGGGSGAGEGGTGGGTAGGDGGAIILIDAQEIVLTGSIANNGDNGVSNTTAGAGGGGAGGSVLVRGGVVTYGTNLITCSAGTGGDGNSTAYGGAGAVGRVRIVAWSMTGSSTTPIASESEGGQAWCGSSGHIF